MKCLKNPGWKEFFVTAIKLSRYNFFKQEYWSACCKNLGVDKAKKIRLLPMLSLFLRLAFRLSRLPIAVDDNAFKRLRIKRIHFKTLDIGFD